MTRRHAAPPPAGAASPRAEFPPLSPTALPPSPPPPFLSFSGLETSRPGRRRSGSGGTPIRLASPAAIPPLPEEGALSTTCSLAWRWTVRITQRAAQHARRDTRRDTPLLPSLALLDGEGCGGGDGRVASGDGGGRRRETVGGSLAPLSILEDWRRRSSCLLFALALVGRSPGRELASRGGHPSSKRET